MTPKQEKLKKLAELLLLDSKGANGAHYLLLDKFNKLIEEIETQIAGLKDQSERRLKAIEYLIRGVEKKRGPKGEDGKTPTKKELAEIIKPLIPEPIKGKDGYTPKKGLDYFDGRDGETPIKGVDYFDGQPGQDGKDADPTLIIEKIESDLPKSKVIRKIKKILKKIQKELDELKKKKLEVIYTGGGSSGGGRIVKSYDLSESLNGSVRTFSLPAFWRIVSVHLSSFPNILRPTIDYTFDASASTITFTSEVPDNSLAAGQTAIIVYSE